MHANTGERDKRGRWKTAPATAWKSGQSGNPNGRSVTEAEIARLARQLVPEAVEQLVEIVRDKKAQAIARVRAVEVLLERGFGRPPQRVMIETDVAVMSNSALAAYIRTQMLEMQHTIEAEPAALEGPAA